MSVSTAPIPSIALATVAVHRHELESAGWRLFDVLLRPLMRIAHVRLNFQLSSAPQPVDAPRGHGRGPDPDKVLLLSSKEFASTGVGTHQLALAGRLANEVSQATRRGTEVDLSVHTQRRIRKAAQFIRDSELQKYDAVVVALGESDAFALTPPQHWSAGMGSLLEQIRTSSVADAPIVVTGVPAITAAVGAASKLSKRAQKHAERLDQATEWLCARGRNTTFVPLPPSTRTGVSSTAAYTESARHIAAQLAPKLTERGLASKPGAPTARSNRSMPQSALGRQQAFLDLRVPLAGSDEQLDRVVNLARTYFGVRHAALVLSDGDSIIFKSKAGFRGNPDLAKLVSPSIEAGRPILIGNTSPAGNGLFAFQVGGTEMGFYAGYPIETPDGFRIGVLALFDPSPRHAGASDTVALRDLSMLLQRELWASAERKG